MGIGGFFKGLGKGLLKAAPIAASFIPGVGPIAAGLIGAGAGAAGGAMGGGGVKGALSGGIQGAGASKGLGPSSGFLGGIGNNITYGEHDWMKNLPGMGGGMFGGLLQQILNRPRNPQQMPPRSDVGTGLGPSMSRRRREMRTPNLTFPIEQGANEARAERGLGRRIPTEY